MIRGCNASLFGDQMLIRLATHHTRCTPDISTCSVTCTNYNLKAAILASLNLLCKVVVLNRKQKAFYSQYSKTGMVEWDGVQDMDGCGGVGYRRAWEGVVGYRRACQGVVSEVQKNIAGRCFSSLQS